MSSVQMAAHFAAESAASTSAQIVTKAATRVTADVCDRALRQTIDAAHEINEAGIRKAALAAAQAAAKVAVVEVLNMTSQIAAEAAARALSQLNTSGIIDTICTRTAERTAASVTAALRERGRQLSASHAKQVRDRVNQVGTETIRSAVEIAMRSAQQTMLTMRDVSLEAYTAAETAADRISRDTSSTDQQCLAMLDEVIQSLD